MSRRSRPLTKQRLARTPSSVQLSKLSPRLYAQFLAKAKDRGFSFLRFRELANGTTKPSQPFIALRHDVDFAPNYSLEMARLEHDEGVRSTFYVLVDGYFYNPLSPEVLQQIRDIHQLGHEIGLHFAAGEFAKPDLGKEIALRLDVLSAIVGERICSFSQHDVVNAGIVTVNLPEGYRDCVDARHVIRDHDLLYVSDSAMMWRQLTFETAMDQNRNLCLLAHPHSWLYPADDYIEMIRDFQVQETTRIESNYDGFVDALIGYYQRRLTEGV